MKKQKNHVKTAKVTIGIAIAALILNILVLPGLGTLIAGRSRTGLWQLILSIVSIPLMFVIIGIPLFIGMWVWGIVTGIELIREADSKQA